MPEAFETAFVEAGSDSRVAEENDFKLKKTGLSTLLY